MLEQKEIVQPHGHNAKGRKHTHVGSGQEG